MRPLTTTVESAVADSKPEDKKGWGGLFGTCREFRSGGEPEQGGRTNICPLRAVEPGNQEVPDSSLVFTVAKNTAPRRFARPTKTGSGARLYSIGRPTVV